MSDDLLPCGHCGDVATEFSSDGLYGIHCANDDCACGTPMLPTRALAIAAWNRRTPTMLDDVRATMREALEERRAEVAQYLSWPSVKAAEKLATIDAALALLDAQSPTP